MAPGSGCSGTPGSGSVDGFVLEQGHRLNKPVASFLPWNGAIGFFMFNVVTSNKSRY